MDATDAGPTAPSPPPTPPPPPYGGPRQLRRRPDDGPLGGVCAGVADYFSVDPVIVRIAAVVLALSGPGIIAYILAWIFVPPTHGPSMAQEWGHHNHPRRDRGGQIFGIILLAVAVSILWGGWWSPVRRWMFPLVLITVGAFLIFRRDEPDGPGDVLPPVPPTPPTPPMATTTSATDATLATDAPAEGENSETGDVTTADATEADTTDATTAYAPPPDPMFVGSPPPPPWDRGRYRHGPWSHGWRPPVPTPEELAARRRRRLVFPVVLGSLLVWGGLAFLAGVSVDTGLAVGLCIVGIGFVLGAFVGGSKALIIPAFLLGSALVLTTALDLPLEGPIGDRSWTPETLGEVEHHYKLSMGEGRLDLTELDLEDGDEVDIRATIGLGHLVVYVPDDVVVDVTADSSAGDISVLGHRDEGLGVSIDRTIDPEERDITLHLDLEVGLGEIEVIARDVDTARQLG